MAGHMQTTDGYDDWLMPTQEDVASTVQQAGKQKNERRSPADYLRVPPPEGAKDWRGARKGASNSVDFWLAPMYAPGKWGIGERSHFVKTSWAKNGTQILCTGNKCLLCAAWFAFKDQDDPDTKAKVEFCKRRYSTLFNVINLSDPSAQTYEDGSVHPLIASFTSSVAKQLYEILDEQGPGICHPAHGRGLRWKKRKDGDRATEVSSYLSVLDTEPLPKDMWHLCRPQNLWQIHEISEALMPSPEEQAEVLSELGLPVVEAHGLPRPTAVAAFDKKPPTRSLEVHPQDLYSDGREQFRAQQAQNKQLRANPTPARQPEAQDMPEDEPPPPEEYFGPPIDGDELPSEPPRNENAPWENYKAGLPPGKGRAR